MGQSKNLKYEEFSNKMRALGLLDRVDSKEIAAKLNMPPKEVNKRLKGMKQRNIGNITVSVNYDKLPLMTARIGLRSVKPRFNQEIFEIVKEMPFVNTVLLTSGVDVTHVVLARVFSFEDLVRLKRKIVSVLSDKLKCTQTMIVSNYYFDEEFFYSPNGGYDGVKLDEKDWQLLSLLKKDAMMPLTELGERMELRAPTVHRRIKMLKDKGIINGFYCKNPLQSYFKDVYPVGSLFILLLKGGPKSENMIIKNIIKDKNGWKSNIFRHYGRWGITFDYWAYSSKSLKKFTVNTLEKSPDVNSIITYNILDYHTRNVFDDLYREFGERHA